MTINVYASVTDIKPRETYERDGVTVSDFFREFYPDFKDDEKQPFSCHFNGALVVPSDWKNTVIGKSDSVDIRLLPKGKAKDYVEDGLSYMFPVHYLTHWAIGKGTQELIRWAMPDYGDDAAKYGRSGNQISVADAKANMARPGEVIPEGFGRYLRYPDYLNQPRRYFIDQKTQSVDMMLCIGNGTYYVDENTTKIGDTPIAETSHEYHYFSPGQTIGVRHRYSWYNNPDVGSTGISSGIRIPNSPAKTQRYALPINYSGKSIVAPFLFPADWVVGDYIQISHLSFVVKSSSPDRLNITGMYGFIDNDLLMLSLIPDGAGLAGQYIYKKVGASNGYLVSSDGLSTDIDSVSSTARAYFTQNNVEYRIASISPDKSTITFDKYIGGIIDSSWTGFGTESNKRPLLDISARRNINNFAGPFSPTPNRESNTLIEFDFFFPNGLGLVDEDGDLQNRTVAIEVLTVTGDSTWESTTFSFTAATRDQIGFTRALTQPNANLIKFRRTTPEGSESNIFDKVDLVGLKARLQPKNSYTGATTVAITINGSNGMASGSSSMVNMMVTRTLTPFDGSGMMQTARISDAFYHIAKSIGYSDSEIDLGRLDALNDIWAARGESFNYFFSETTAKDAIDAVLSLGGSALTVDFGILRPVRDGVRTQPESVYSPENMLEPLSRTFAAKLPDDFTGVQVEYTNPTTWTTETVNCFLPGDSTAKLDKMTIVGACTRTQAWRLGMRRRRSQVYRKWSYEFETELDALNNGYLSYVSLVDNIPGYGKVALMRSVSSDRVVLSEPVEFEAGKSHVIAYRNLEGELVGPFPATQGPDEYTVMCSIPAPLPVNYNDREQIHFYFGTTENWQFPALITEIQPSGENRFRVTAINYDARVYADDNNTPPA